jgi:glycosyltransferase involved in cell wall biosynthesis
VRLLWVVPRYGATIVGGAETLVRGLATRGVPPGWTSEIATTCAIDHATWANALPQGETSEDGLRVHRFEVGPRDDARAAELHARVMGAAASYVDELEWLANGVWSPGLERFLVDAGAEYDLIVFAPYLFGTTLWGAQVAPKRSAVLPCLHDEPYAYLATVKSVVEASRGCIFNTDAEQRLARKLYRVRDGAVVGMGFDPPGPVETRFAEPRGLGPYVLYAGRLEEGKRVDLAVEYAVRYAAERRNAPRLVLIGSGHYRPPRDAAHVAFHVGYVSEDEKRAAYAEAVALVQPSRLESLSLVLMEAWLEGTPALATVESDVLRDHCEASGGGVLFDSYESFRDGLDRLLGDDDERRRLGDAGRSYVLERYSWDAVSGRLAAAVARFAA